MRPFLREQHPVLVGVDAGRRRAAGRRAPADVVVVDARGGEELPSAEALKAARDVVVPRRPRRRPRSATERLERLGVRPLRFETAATAEDAALVLADAAEAVA